MLLSNNEKIKDDIIDASGLGLWEVIINTTTGVFEMHVDDRLAKLYGITDANMTSVDAYAWWFNHMDDESKGLVNEELTKAVTTDVKEFEIQYLWHGASKILYLRTWGRLISFVDGVVNVLGVTQDISEQYKTTIMLEKQLLNFELASEIGNYAVFEFEYSTGENFSDNILIRTNSLFSAIFGKQHNIVDVEAWQGLCYHFSEGECGVWNSLLDYHTWIKDTKIEHELFCTLDDGTEKWLSLTYKVVQSSDSKLRLIGFLKDISVMKEREAQLEDANITKSMFLANMSHEIRTPMNAVINFAKFMLDTKLDNTQLSYINRIISSSTHMLNIINDILDFSKIEANKMTIENAPYLTRQEQSFINELILKNIDDKHILSEISRDDKIPAGIIGDAIRMRQVLLNILSNAIKFTPEGGKVTFTVLNIEQTEDTVWLKFIISDTGIGMSQEQLANLFSAFTQADISITRRFGGTGLGLVISKTLVELMGGTIAVESELRQGTTFTVIVPFGIASDEEVARMEEDALKTNLPEKNVRFSNLKALVAEDNMINQEVVRAMLSTLSVEVDIVNNGEEAINSFINNENLYDCIFMDVQMPVLDGLSATKKIRALHTKRAKEIPIFALTANAIRGEDDKSMEAGMNEHLTKPLSKTEIIKTLTKYFSHKIIV